jgi:uncharacterized protein YbcC (UPF0753/DUF2309 family)
VSFEIGWPPIEFLPAARAFVVFQLAQVLGWVPARLAALTPTDWETLRAQIEAFTATDRERVFHKAYERRFMRQSLDALTAHQPSPPTPVVSFQAVFCIDAREESFRRHLEEVCPSVQTLGAAGFFGVPIYYKGATDAHFATLCPIVVQPRHWVIEEAVPEQERTHRQRATARWLWGRTSHLFHIAGRSTVPGAVLSACVGPLAILPMMSRVLFPRLDRSDRPSRGTLCWSTADSLALGTNASRTRSPRLARRLHRRRDGRDRKSACYGI